MVGNRRGRDQEEHEEHNDSQEAKEDEPDLSHAVWAGRLLENPRMARRGS